MGVQALNDADLKFLGRKHSVAEARAAWRAAAAIFPRASFDLIYARPGQTNAAWERELNEVLDEKSFLKSGFTGRISFDAGRRFFALPLEAKQSVKIREQRGYQAYKDVTRPTTPQRPAATRSVSRRGA